MTRFVDDETLDKLVGRLSDCVMKLHYVAGQVSYFDKELGAELRAMADELNESLKRLKKHRKHRSKRS